MAQVGKEEFSSCVCVLVTGDFSEFFFEVVHAASVLGGEADAGDVSGKFSDVFDFCLEGRIC